jgi:hypothetical protein
MAADYETARLRFSFLDHNQGAVIQVVHTGTSSRDVSICGTVVGAGVPHKVRAWTASLLRYVLPGFLAETLSPRQIRIGFMSLVFLTFLLILLTWGLVIAATIRRGIPVDYLTVGILGGYSATFFAECAILLSRMRRIPRGLDSFGSEREP